MNLILVRKNSESYGIFGELLDEKYAFICMTLEHAYLQESLYCPKIPIGEYECTRGQHQLENMDHPFETFEIINVPNHTNILFHVGNYNQDSHGCVLLGKFIGGMLNGDKMITGSRETFSMFMQLQNGIDSFKLKVE